MAGPKKRALMADRSESSASESETESYNGQEADFEGRNPEAVDFEGIRQLLKQLFLKAHINLSQMSDMLIAQQGIGSVLKQSFDDDEEDDDLDDVNDVFGITSVVNLTSNKNTECVQQLFQLLKELSSKHAGKPTQIQINELLSDADVTLGLIINERFVNIPAKVADPLFSSLSDELDKAAARNEAYVFTHFMLISKIHRPKGQDKKESEVIFANAEEEVFTKEADLKFEFDVISESDTGLDGRWHEGDREMVPYRRVVIFKASKLKPAIVKIRQIISQ